MHDVIDLTPYLPPQSRPRGRQDRLYRAIERAVTVAIGLCVVVGAIIVLSL